MKTKLTFLALLISIVTVAQNGINYKALIKDANGNVMASSPLSIQFIIYEDAALTNNVYQETHTINTDSNGFVIVNIGEGTTSDNFDSIDWSSETHSLNVQVNTGSEFIDLGTSEFKHVPYSKYAKKASIAENVSGLEAIDEGNGIGWRLVGRNPENHGNIGENAVDFSTDPFASDIRGATGTRSIAFGIGNKASGLNSFVMGQNVIAEGDNSTAFGVLNTAIGYLSTSIGFRTRAEASNSFVIGRYNIGGGNPTEWSTSDPLFEVGNGISNAERSNALTILKSGYIGIGTNTPQELLHITEGRLRIGNETIEDGGSDVLAFSSSLVPTVDEGDRLGGPNRKWLDVWASDGTINTSDRRSKENISNLNYGLAEVLQMQPVSYTWKNRKNQDIKLGLIAQDLLKITPEVVKTHIWEKDETSGVFIKQELNRMGVYYSDLIPVLIKAIQEQQKIIESQGDALIASKSNYEALLSRIEILESKSSN